MILDRGVIHLDLGCFIHHYPRLSYNEGGGGRLFVMEVTCKAFRMTNM